MFCEAQRGSRKALDRRPVAQSGGGVHGPFCASHNITLKEADREE
jgi:hypothetical protein